MILTTKILKNNNVCKNGISFFNRNFPNGLDLNKWKIYGDFYGYKQHLEDIILDNRHKVYNEIGKIIERTDDENCIRRYKYDEQNNLIEELFEDGNKISHQYKYDTKNNLIEQIYRDGTNIKYEYDDKNNLIKQIEDEKIWKFEYDKYNNKIKEINSAGNIFEFEYDIIGNLTKVHFYNVNSSNITKYNYVFNKEKLLTEIWKDDVKICWLEEIMTNKTNDENSVEKEDKIDLSKYSYDKPADPITQWYRDNEPDDKMLYKKSLGNQICFIRDTIMGILASSYEEYIGIKHNANIKNCHTSKSVLLPVYEINFKNCHFTMRNNFHDWKISVNLSYEIPNLEYSNFEGLFDPEKKIDPIYCEGFSKTDVYQSFNEYIQEVSSEKTYPDRKFTIEMYDNFKVYTFFYILNIKYLAQIKK